MTATATERLASATAFIENDIANNKLVMYAKTWCPHCKAAKALLAESYPDVKSLIRDLDVMDEPSGPCLAKALADFSGQTSVPNIFIDGQQFGGNSDLQEAHKNGTLKLNWFCATNVVDEGIGIEYYKIYVA